MTTPSLQIRPPGAPGVGDLVEVRGRQWVVADVAAITPGAPGEDPGHFVSLISIDDDATGEELQVVWEVEAGTRVVDKPQLPVIDPTRLDEPIKLDALLNAVRWGAVTRADHRQLQAPFRSGADIETYQLEPLVRALDMPRASLLIADDVGLGKTIEAGLVAQELLLRHRARSVLIVCPAPLQLQWKEEMLGKFGLNFQIVNRELLTELRKKRGADANPFSQYPRLIVSIDWLKGQLGMRLLREATGEVAELPRTFDLLIVDEVHNCAPSSGTENYAVDTLRTRAIRRLSEHCEHRLFLSATPHNGYANSFQALLELLDPHRFARGVEPSPEALQQVLVRRLKSEIVDDDGNPRFARREIIPLEVQHSDEEREAYRLLLEYAAARQARLNGGQPLLPGTRACVANDLVVTLLKKRFFSSPRAFALTLARHRATLKAKQAAPRAKSESGLQLLRRYHERLSGEIVEDDDAELLDDALDAAVEHEDEGPSAEELTALDALGRWADVAANRPDTRTQRLIDWVEEILRPGGKWSDQRVILFTEYRDTQAYLHEQFLANGYPKARLALLNGETDPEQRERIKQEWQEPPDQYPVRLLIATDAASEGISLQRQCHRLAHVEIPWNPNRLEQRNGRVDRHGQPASRVLIHHLASAGWSSAGQSTGRELDSDLAFLARVAHKVDRIRADLGSAGPVIAEEVEAVMLGRSTGMDEQRITRRSSNARLARAELQLKERTERLRNELDSSRQELRVSPETIATVVNVGLEIAGQPALEPSGKGGQFHVPPLTGSWASAVEGIEHPLTQQPRPVTFDPSAASHTTDVVYLHLGHRLVQRAVALLRAELWARDTKLSRVAVRPATVAQPTAVAHGRLVITGKSGHRLHEEVIAAGLVQSANGGWERVNVSDTDAALDAIDEGRAVDARRAEELAGRFADVEPQLQSAIQARGNDRARQLRETLSKRAEQDRTNVAKVMLELKASIEQGPLKEDFGQQEALFAPEEFGQREEDLSALRRRVEAIPADIRSEQEAIARRYADPVDRLFPVAITLLVPATEALG